MPKPGVIPFGTAIYIPPAKRVVPKLIKKVTPVYPRAVEPGQVVLDVTLDGEGRVEKVEVVDGNAILALAAVSAVKQWTYRPLVVKGKAVNSFVLAVTFGKNGKVKF
jgi:TonB family protein